MVGLLIGVPIFYLTIDILKELDKYITRVRGVAHVVSKAEEMTRDSLDNDIRLSRSGKRAVK
jgi:hypothetical protein